jgi:hypothetical protein
MALNGYLAARDYIVASINYGWAEVPLPAGRDDVLSAIAYLKVYGGKSGSTQQSSPFSVDHQGTARAARRVYGRRAWHPRGDLRLRTDGHALRVRASRAEAIFDTRNILETYLGGPPDKVDDAYFAARRSLRQRLIAADAHDPRSARYAGVARRARGSKNA